MAEQGKASPPTTKSSSATARLLAWYDRERRDLPWRRNPDPYNVWLSEVMLQQTTVATVAPRFQAFLQRWPNVGALAQASMDDVLHEWQGLGYYARARNLHRCAKIVTREHRGIFPDTELALRKLPGIGDYTAAAIAAIAFDRRSAPVDGNIIRVISRLKALNAPMPAGKKQVVSLVAEMVPADRPGDFAQAMMDLGATVCTPRNPICGGCPWTEHCQAHEQGVEESFPVKVAKRDKPTRHGVIFWLTDAEGRALLRRRPEKGLLGGMMEFPSTDWRDLPWTDAEAIGEFPAANSSQPLCWRSMEGVVKHTFTHFHLVLKVMKARCGAAPTNGVWCAPGQFGEHALPTVMKKVAARALSTEATDD